MVPGAGIGRAATLRACRRDADAARRVQIFGVDKDQATRAAVRFFKERRVGSTRSTCGASRSRRASCGGSSSGSVPAALLDTEGRAYRDAGLGYLRMDDGEIVERLLADPRLLRLPLVRFGNEA